MTLNPETKHIYFTSFNNNQTTGNETVKKKQKKNQNVQNVCANWKGVLWEQWLEENIVRACGWMQ